MSEKRTQLIVFGYAMDTHYEPSKVEAPPPPPFHANDCQCFECIQDD
jgi:hypothetical protein